MFHFYVLNFFKKGDTIQGGTLFKGGHYLRKYGTTFDLCKVNFNASLWFTSVVILTLSCQVIDSQPKIITRWSNKIGCFSKHKLICIGIPRLKESTHKIAKFCSTICLSIFVIQCSSRLKVVTRSIYDLIICI